MNFERMKKQLEEHKNIPFPVLPDGFGLWAEFVGLDGDLAGEVQGIIGQSQDGFSDYDYYKNRTKEIKAEAQDKGFDGIIKYLQSLEKLLQIGDS